MNFLGTILARADLSGSNLYEASFTGATLIFSNFSGANLIKVDLTLANLLRINLDGADMTSADLTFANLARTSLSRTNLTESNLSGSHLATTSLESTIFSNSIFGDTSIVDCNLSKCEGLATITHQGPSNIGLNTLVHTFRGAGNRWTPELISFFIGAGIPQEVLEGLPRIIGEVKYSSCFIAYGEPDRGFAERLYADLREKGVSRWMYAMDSMPGERTWQEIIKNRREAEKFIVLCSVQGLVRDGVLKEIEEQMDEDQEKIIPISLDDTWKQDGFHLARGTRNLKPFLMERNYADFGDDRDYEQSLQRLLRALERRDA